MTSKPKNKSPCVYLLKKLGFAFMRLLSMSPVNGRTKKEFSYFYTVEPSNFVSLPMPKQKEKMGAFFDLLRSLEKEIKITFMRKSLPVQIDGNDTLKPVLQILVASHEPLDGIFDTLHYEYTVDAQKHSRLEIIKENVSDLSVKLGESGTKAIAKCYALYKIPKTLPWGWIHQIFSTCHEIDVKISPVMQDKALRAIRTKQSLVMEKAKNSRLANEEYAHLLATEKRLVDGTTTHFDFSMNCTLLASSKKEFKKIDKEFKKITRISGGSFDGTLTKQGAIYTDKWSKYLRVEIATLSVVYPFVSADMLEQPNGIVLGINTDTGGPIIYDIAKRINGNVAIIGTSGSGKSFTSKLFVKRLLERLFVGLEISKEFSVVSRNDERPACFILDPMNEYFRYRKYFGLAGLQISGKEELGIDPFKTLEKANAASVLAQFTKAPPVVANEFASLADEVNSVEELFNHKKISVEAKKYLAHLVNGPLTRIMKGSPKINDQVIISLNGATGKDHEVLILLLLLNKIWQRVFEMPKERQKIIVIDEGWLLFKMEGAIDYIDQIIRMGRKINVKFVFISQKVDDLVNEKGAESRMIDNIATKILMRLEEDSAVKAQQILKLSDAETSKLTKFSPGNGLILTEKHRITAKFEARKEEIETYFNTTVENGP